MLSVSLNKTYPSFFPYFIWGKMIRCRYCLSKVPDYTNILFIPFWYHSYNVIMLFSRNSPIYRNVLSQSVNCCDLILCIVKVNVNLLSAVMLVFFNYIIYLIRMWWKLWQCFFIVVVIKSVWFHENKDTV